MNPQYAIVLFFSTSAAMRAESLANQAGLSVKLVPVPRHLSSDCGVAMRCAAADRETMDGILHQHTVEFDRICHL